MDPGDLNMRFVLQSKSATQDGVGGEVVTWTDEAVVWGSALTLSGRELIAAQQKHAETTMRFRIRFRTDVLSQWRVIWERRAYDILEIVDIGHLFLDLDCQTGLRDG